MARVSGFGFYHVPGVDFKESLFPMAQELSTWVMLFVLIIKKLSAMLANFETAFL